MLTISYASLATVAIAIPEDSIFKFSFDWINKIFNQIQLGKLANWQTVTPTKEQIVIVRIFKIDKVKLNARALIEFSLLDCINCSEQTMYIAWFWFGI